MVKYTSIMSDAQGICVGPLPNFEKFGMSVESHPKPQFSTAENEFVIKFKTAEPLKITGKVLNMETSTESRESVFVQTQGVNVSILVSLHHTGYHKLQLYALPRSHESHELPNVFNYVINCTATPRKCRVFPKQFSQWRDGCALYEPFSLVGDRVKGDVVFRLKLPDALAVAVTIGEKWFHLEPTDDGIWQGTVNSIDKFKGQNLYAVVNANLDNDDETKYASLLQFKM